MSDVRWLNLLNRAAILVRPKKPYLDWARALDDSELVPDSAGERTVYLVPEHFDPDEAREVLASVYRDVFAEELRAWHTDESAWPRDRRLAVFLEWFEVEINSLVVDLCADPLERERE